MTQPRFEGKTVVVTGAGRGIGRATAERFAAEGASVAMISRSEGALAEAAEAIVASGGRALAIPADVSDPEDVAQAVLHFVSDRSAKSTGNILNVDGGVAAAYPR